MYVTKKSLKSSLKVSLVLLGGSLVACDDDPYGGVRKPSKGETRYDYRHRDECVKDWGQQCPPQSQGVGSGSGTGSGMYHYYRYEDKAKAKSQTHAVNIQRGGFGGKAKSSS